jgi:hypothetical protein
MYLVWMSAVAVPTRSSFIPHKGEAQMGSNYSNGGGANYGGGRG